MAQLTGQLVAIMHILAVDRDTTIRLEAPSSDIVVACSERHIQAAFSVLVENAVKWGTAGDDVVVRVTRSASPWARIAILDRGVAVSPEEREDLFGPPRVTTRAANSTAANSVWLDHVLHIVVHWHHGNVRYERLDDSNAFYSALPVAGARDAG